jgi:hypothetical protein
MDGRRARPILVGILALLLGACAAAPPPVAPPPPAPPVAAPTPPQPGTAPPPTVTPGPAPLSARQQLAAGHRDRAQRLEGAGDLRQALDEWKIALTIDPADTAAQEGRRQLATRLERSIGERLGQGREALGKGEHLEARWTPPTRPPSRRSRTT